MKKLLFTTSWDDGLALDTKIVELLNENKIKGTFYILPENAVPETVLLKEKIEVIGKNHEIGAHTMTHHNLADLSLQEAKGEITKSKQWIESITGKPCEMFCYPRGFANNAIQSIVQKAGFIGARSVQQMSFSSNDFFMLPTTLHAYPFPWRPKWKQWWHPLDPVGPLRVKFAAMQKMHLPFSAYKNWLSLAKGLFMHALNTHQLFFHLWGHSKEIERYAMWDDVQQFLEFVHKHDAQITAVTNTELVKALQE